LDTPSYDKTIMMNLDTRETKRSRHLSRYSLVSHNFHAEAEKNDEKFDSLLNMKQVCQPLDHKAILRSHVSRYISLY